MAESDACAATIEQIFDQAMGNRPSVDRSKIKCMICGKPWGEHAETDVRACADKIPSASPEPKACSSQRHSLDMTPIQ